MSEAAKPPDGTLMRAELVADSNKSAVLSHGKRPRLGRDRALGATKSMSTEDISGNQFGDEAYKDPDVLHELYVERDLKQSEIAALFDCTQAAISYWVGELDIESRGQGTNDPDAPWRDESRLRELYVEREWSTLKIADEWGCSKQTVNRWLDVYEIDRRNPTEAKRLYHGSDPVNFYTDSLGYERWGDSHGNGEKTQVSVHRLLAVAEFGFDAVRDKNVHHTLDIPWSNWGDVIELLTDAEHAALHAVGRERDIQGNFK